MTENKPQPQPGEVWRDEFGAIWIVSTDVDEFGCHAYSVEAATVQACFPDVLFGWTRLCALSEIPALIAERDALRIDRDRLEGVATDAALACQQARDERDALRESLGDEHELTTRLRCDLNEEKAIVNRIWDLLGSPTYESLKDKSIYDLISALLAREKALREALNRCIGILDALSIRENNVTWQRRIDKDAIEARAALGMGEKP